MFIKDSSDQALILLGIKDANQVFYFPSNTYQFQSKPDLNKHWGIYLKIDPRKAIEEQISSTLLASKLICQRQLSDITICSNFRTKIFIDSVPTSLYLVLTNFTLTQDLKDLGFEFKTLPQILKYLGNNRNRISYSFIVQYLSTNDLESLDACSLDKDQLSSLIEKNKS